jgi:DNA-binding MarR family transcriptional regulator
VPGSKQQTLDDIRLSVKQADAVKALNQTQLNIIKFYEQGYYPAFIAHRLKISRSYVSRTTRQLSDLGLILPNKSRDPIQGKATTYQVTPLLKQLLFDYNLDKSATYTLCTPHHLKIKYPILHMKGEIRLDGWKFSRNHATHIKSWQPRGPQRHQFHVSTKQGTVGIEFHGKSILAYRIGHDHIIADTVESATRLAAIQIQEGVDLFVKEQTMLGTKIELGRPQISDKPHYAFESEIAHAVLDSKGQVNVKGMWVDTSPEGQGRPGVGDIETRNPVIATMVDKGLRNAMNIEGIVQEQIIGAIPAFIEAIDQKISPLQEEVESLSSRITESNTLQTQFNQLVSLLQNTIKELESIKEGQTVVETAQTPPDREDLTGMYQ